MASVPVQVDYNHELKPLEDLLSRVERPGDFFVTGRLVTPMPKAKSMALALFLFLFRPRRSRKSSIKQTAHPGAEAGGRRRSRRKGDDL